MQGGSSFAMESWSTRRHRTDVSPPGLFRQTRHEDLAVWSRTVAHSLADLAGSNGEFTVVARLRV